jgi:branched-chain amino acid transport system substrate-binding protein
MKRHFAILFALALTATIAPLRAADEPFDLYAILPLTGSAAFLGRGEAQSAQAFEKYVNAHGGIRSRPLHIVIEDDQSNPQVAVQLVNQIMAKNAAAFVGPAFGPECQAIMPLVVQNGPVMYCLSPSLAPPSGSYVFSVMPSNRDVYANAIRYLKAKGVKTIAFLAGTDASGQEQEASTMQAVKNYPDLKDLKLLADEHMGLSDVSAAAQLARIKASGAQAMVVFVTGTGFATVLRAANDVGYDGAILAGSANGIKEQIVSYSAFLPKTLLFTTLPFQMDIGVAPAVKQSRTVFFGAMKEVTAEAPGVPQGVPWDALTIVIDGFRKVGPQATAVQIRDYILGVRGFAGIMGNYDFRSGDQRGLDPRSTGAMTWDKSTQSFVVVSRPGGSPL